MKIPSTSGFIGSLQQLVAHTWLTALYTYLDTFIGLFNLTQLSAFVPVRAMTSGTLPSHRYTADMSGATAYKSSWSSSGPSAGAVVAVPRTGGGTNFWVCIVGSATTSGVAPAGLAAAVSASGTFVADGATVIWGLLNQFQLLHPAYQTSWATTGPGAGTYVTVSGNTWKATTATGVTAGTTPPTALSAASPALGTTVVDSNVTWTFVPAMSQTKFAVATGALGALDTGVTCIAGDHIYDNNTATGSQRGLFLIQSVGGSGLYWTMKRSNTASQSSDYIAGRGFSTGSEGTANASKTFMLTNVVGFILDTTTPAVVKNGATTGGTTGATAPAVSLTPTAGTTTGASFTSSTAASAGTPATVTLSAAGWTINQFTGGVLVDHNEAVFLITSNTATVLTLAGVGTPATGAWTIFAPIAASHTHTQS